MKRIIAENVSVGIRLEYDSDSNKTFCIISTQTMSNHFCSDLKTALQVFDNKVDLAIQNQPEKDMSGIDLENSTKTYLDLEDVSYPFKCQTDDGRTATVIAERRTEVNDATYIVIIDHANSKDCWSNDERLFLSDRVGHLYFADGDGQTGSHLIPIQPPKPVVRTGWINIYSSDRCSSNIYPTEKVAIVSANNAASLVKTIEITWEE